MYMYAVNIVLRYISSGKQYSPKFCTRNVYYSTIVFITGLTPYPLTIFITGERKISHNKIYLL